MITIDQNYDVQQKHPSVPLDLLAKKNKIKL